MNGEPLTPEEYQALLQAGVDNTQLDALMQMQMQQAQQLRQGAKPQMRDAGRLTQAPHWLEMVGGLARQGVAGMKDKQAIQSQQRMGQNQSMQNQMLLKAMLGGQGGQGQAPGGPAQPAPNAQAPYAPFMFGSKT